jgi:uncharacterized membrane protein YphA (DoxX/SURF4 family)
MRVGVYVYGIASVAAGIMDLVWGEFEAAHQPIQAFGDHIPGREIFAYLAAVWLVAGGVAILWRQTARAGAAALAILYCIFAVFWFPRLYTAPHVLGYRITVYIGVLGGVGEQLILVVAAAIVYASLAMRGSLSLRAALIVRWTFGLCSVDFVLAHLTGVQAVAPMVPKWMPLGGDFWTVFIGRTLFRNLRLGPIEVWPLLWNRYVRRVRRLAFPNPSPHPPHLDVPLALRF